METTKIYLSLNPIPEEKIGFSVLGMISAVEFVERNIERESAVREAW